MAIGLRAVDRPRSTNWSLTGQTVIPAVHRRQAAPCARAGCHRQAFGKPELPTALKAQDRRCASGRERRRGRRANPGIGGVIAAGRRGSQRLAQQPERPIRSRSRLWSSQARSEAPVPAVRRGRCRRYAPSAGHAAAEPRSARPASRGSSVRESASNWKGAASAAPFFMSARRGGAAQAVVDRGAEAARPGSARRRSAGGAARSAPWRRVEQAGGGFDRSPRGAERGVAGDRAEADQPFVRSARDRRRAGAAWPAHNGWRAGRAPRSAPAAALRRSSAEVDRAGPQQARPCSPVDRDDGRFEAVRGRAAVDDQRDPAAEAGEDMLGAGRADPAAGIGRGRGERPAGRREQVAHRRMGGRAERDGRQAGGDQRGDAARPARSGRTRVSGPGQ